MTETEDGQARNLDRQREPDLELADDLTEPVSVQKQEVEVMELVKFQSGPLPPPRVLLQYNESVPDAAERILRMAEDEAEYRRECGRSSMMNSFKLAARGQLMGFTIALLSVGGGLVVIALEKPLVGAAGALTGIGALVGLFLWNKSQAHNVSLDRLKNLWRQNERQTD